MVKVRKLKLEPVTESMVDERGDASFRFFLERLEAIFKDKKNIIKETVWGKDNQFFITYYRKK